MSGQNFNNHRQVVPHYHYITSVLLIALLIGSIRNVFVTDGAAFYSATLILLVAIILIIFYFYSRGFALKAQDRAIRAEENLRHFALTGKLLPQGLRMGQIIALRFASDEEFVALTEKAVAESMSSNEIKKSISNWRADTYRV